MQTGSRSRGRGEGCSRQLGQAPALCHHGFSSIPNSELCATQGSLLGVPIITGESNDDQWQQLQQQEELDENRKLAR